VCVCVCVCVCACACVRVRARACVCVRARARARQRERESACMQIHTYGYCPKNMIQWVKYEDMCICSFCNDSVSTPEVYASSGRMVLSNESEGMWKDAVMHILK
jgi:hypothetical protein